MQTDNYLNLRSLSKAEDPSVKSKMKTKSWLYYSTIFQGRKSEHESDTLALLIATL